MRIVRSLPLSVRGSQSYVACLSWWQAMVPSADYALNFSWNWKYECAKSGRDQCHSSRATESLTFWSTSLVMITACMNAHVVAFRKEGMLTLVANFKASCEKICPVVFLCWWYWRKKNVTEKSLDNQGTPVHWWSFRYYGHSPQTNSSLQFYQTPSNLTLLERATLIGELTDGIPLGGKVTRGSFIWRFYEVTKRFTTISMSRCRGRLKTCQRNHEPQA